MASAAASAAASSGCLIEVVTSPNNPDGRTGGASGRTHRVIHDLVYAWPGVSAVPAMRPSERPAVLVFSLAKLSGYAASRVGWAFVRDRQLAAAMSRHLFLTGEGAGVEALYRTIRVVDAIVSSLHDRPTRMATVAPTDTRADMRADMRADRPPWGLLAATGSFFDFVRATLTRRWQTLAQVLAGQTLLSLDGVSGHLFAWLRCHGPVTGDACAQLFAEDVRVSSGDAYFGKSGAREVAGASERALAHIRIAMGQEQSTFDLMIAAMRRVLQKHRSAPKYEYQR